MEKKENWKKEVKKEGIEMQERLSEKLKTLQRRHSSMIIQGKIPAINMDGYDLFY